MPEDEQEFQQAVVLQEFGGVDVPVREDPFKTHIWNEQARPIRLATPGELRTLQIPPGSMCPGFAAVCRFVEAAGAMASRCHAHAPRGA